MRVVTLRFVEGRQDIQDSLNRFNIEAQQNYKLARNLLRKTWYWVYDPGTKTFGPSKFVGYRNMNFNDYIAARGEQYSQGVFDGYKTHKAIEKILAPYTDRPQMKAELVLWGESLLGSEVFSGIDDAKWKFTYL